MSTTKKNTAGLILVRGKSYTHSNVKDDKVDTTTYTLHSFAPDSVSVEWELNETFQATFTAADDGSAAFQALLVQNQVNVDGQWYVIKQFTPDYSGGITTFSVTATHVVYEVLQSSRIYHATEMRWLDADNHLQNPTAKEGRTEKEIDPSELQDKTNESDDATTDSTVSNDNSTINNDQQTTVVSVSELLKSFFPSGKIGEQITYEIHGDFSPVAIALNQDLQAADVIDLIKTNWTSAIIMPDNFKLIIYSDTEFYKHNGNRIDYLHDTSEMQLSYDTTNLTNAARLIGASYNDASSGNVSGITTAQNGDWGPAIRNAASMMNVSISDSQVELIKSVIQHESRGDEKAINNWDSNAAKGTPSKGLLQYIDSSFKKYQVSGHTNIWSGFDQLLALFNDSNWVSDCHVGGWGPTGTKRMDKVAKSEENMGAKKWISVAKSYVGIDYVYGGGHSASGDPKAGMDCSGLGEKIAQACGLDIGWGATTTLESQGNVINRSEVQTGDMGFYGSRVSSYHVVWALDNRQFIAEPQPGQKCYIGNIDGYPADFWVRNPKIAAFVGNGTTSGSGGSGESTVTVYYFTPFYYINQESAKRWGIHETDDITSDSISTVEEMKKYADKTFSLNPEFNLTATLDANTEIVKGDITHVSIRPANYETDLKLVGYTQYPYSSAQQPSVTYNSNPATILDFYTSQEKKISSVQRQLVDATKISRTNQNWLNNYVGGETNQ